MKFVAFLRGMNLGRRRITNDELCAEIAALGFEGVTAFLASGNVIFEAEPGDPSGLEDRIEKGLERSLGWVVPTFVRSGEEVKAIVARKIFERQLAGTAGRIQVALLAAEPTRKAARDVLELATPDDSLALHGRELYWLPRGNLMDSELDLKAIGERLGPMTIRTKRTVERLAARFLSA